MPNLADVSLPVCKHPCAAAVHFAQVAWLCICRTGLRMIHGDVCDGLASLIDDTDGQGTCLIDWCGDLPNEPERNHSWLWLLLHVMLLTLLCAGAYGWYKLRASPEQREWLAERATLAAELLSEVWVKVAGRLRRRPTTARDPADDLGYFQPLAAVPPGDAQSASLFTLGTR
eukprot:357733-Chlamydomonas_euryale.AAC.4